MAGGILWFTHLSMKSINVYKYPIGKLRVQPVGIIIFAAVMATLGMLAFSPNGKWLSNLVTSFLDYLLVCDMCTAMLELYSTECDLPAKVIYINLVSRLQASKYLFKLLKS